jgi:hypothetical protein
MSESITHVLIVTDKSGSMATVADDVRGGFNTYLDTLAADGNNYRLTVTLFDTRYTAHAVDAPISAVPRFDARNYSPGGMTALYDAIGKTLTDFDAKHGPLGEDERALLVIQTDGEENSSREFSQGAVKKMLADREAAGKWGCLFMGAGPEAWRGGHSLGLGATTVSTRHDSEGTQSSYVAMAAATRSYSGGASVGETFTVLEEGVKTGEGGS